MILVLDFGGQYAHIIARRIRELGVYSDVKPCDISLGDIGKLRPDGIVLSGGPSSVYEHNAPFMNKKVLDLKIPVLGICYGEQLIGKFVGGTVLAGKRAWNHRETSLSERGIIILILGITTGGLFYMLFLKQASFVHIYYQYFFPLFNL